MVGISLASSIAATGLACGALGHSVISAKDFEEHLQVTLDSTSVSLASLQRQLTSLAQVALQNLRALELLTAEKGGTCLFLQEECCYINESGLVERNIDTLSCLSEEIQLCKTKNSSVLDWTQSPLLFWVLPFLAPLIVVFTLLSFLPCTIKTLQNFLLDHVSTATNQRFNELLLQGYQSLWGHQGDPHDNP
jgi:hypothetical protein